MAINDRNDTREKLTDTPMNPGDEAPPGTTGTGENICPDCAGTGRRNMAPCPTCNETGKIIQGVGGGRYQVGSAAGRWQLTRYDDVSEPVPWLPLPG